MDETAFVNETKTKMSHAIEAYKAELAKIRTGRASTGLIEAVNVEYYGSVSPIIRLASISIPDSRTISINPWDAGSLPAIEKAIQKYDPSLNPSNDGKSINIKIPALTQERRKEITKQVGKLSESIKQEIRNFRRLSNEKIKTYEKSKEISEDQSFKIQKKVQDLTDNFIKEIDEITKRKEKEISEV
ncbi:MAG: ribosome recycling factor [Candidatus Acidulodesulfobacterium acidiphilum]|uniref:Ribosome-recycling factor n=1 Tax=Candidatus Acidulodesulfobacterium acidiphilum TaxID=2597224 RepID=A0A520X9F1_9DELT|nr:MAG: ribosome recycling factor [Candidatus Acidulodesulfobacterium acidiphilum]